LKVLFLKTVFPAYIVFKKIFLEFSAVGVRNEPRQIQHVGVHCVHPDLPQNNYLKYDRFSEIKLHKAAGRR
jgi:hypothetical protein